MKEQILSKIAEIPGGEWTILALLALIMFAFTKTFGKLFAKLIHKITSSSNIDYDDLIAEKSGKPIWCLAFLLVMQEVILYLNLFEELGGLKREFKVAFLVIFIWFSFRITDVLVVFIGRRFGSDGENLKNQFMPLIERGLKTVVVVLGILALVHFFGYSIASLLTGLGIGGLAIALAAQETLANFFASIMLLTDMPFRVGDWVFFQSVEGTVESIGFRSTRIRTFKKSLISVPNKVFMNQSIENFTLRDRRRIYMNIGLTYDSPAESLQGFIDEIKAYLADSPDIRDDFYLVNFDEFKDSSLNIMIYCFTTTTDWQAYLNIKQALNFKIMAIAKSRDLHFAFPSRSVYLENQAQHPGIT